MRLIIALCFFCLSFTTFSKTYEINSEHSSILFKIPFMRFGEVEGRFKKFVGTYDFDSKTNKVKNLEVVIDTKSIDTADKKRDRHLRKNDFFDVRKFPHIKFIGKEYGYEKESLSKVTGELTVKDKIYPLTIRVDWKGKELDPFNKSRASYFFSGKTSVNRKEIGLSWNKELDQGGWLVGNEVELRFQVEANPTDKKPAFSRFLTVSKKIDRSELAKIGKEKVSKTTDKKQPKVIEKIIIKKVGETNSFEKAGFIGFAATGFLSLIGLLTLSWLGRKYTALYLEKRNYDEKKVMIFADLVFCMICFIGAVLTAPFMGYSKFLF
ncbi:YceI family protein [Bacteriovoracaceae bacterium]|nr:YceI family protein [Bacteriovoracaceae bacterium]|tara:strand:+ start:91533 stop:92501 length:969 start_codon:yes stop_codon:yes gene_type:complete